MKDNQYSTNTANDDEIEIDLRELLIILKKWSKLIITMTLLFAFSVGIISYFILSPVYEAKTLLMVTQATDKLIASSTQQQGGLEDVVSTVSNIPVLTMQTYLGQLKSEGLMLRIIDRLKLEYSPAALANMINPSIVKDSNLIEVRVTNGDPALASRIAGVLCEEYLALMNERNQEQMSRSVDFLEKQIEITDKELEQATEYMKHFQSQPRGVAVLEAEFTNATADVATFNTRLQTVQIEITQLYSGINQLEQELSITPQMLAVEKFDENRGTIVHVQESNPLYISLAEKITEKRAALAEKTGEHEALQGMVISLQGELDYLQAELASKRTEQDSLERKVEFLKTTSQTLAEKTTETRIAKSIDLGDTSVLVVSEASIPTSPIKPNKKLNVCIAIILGLVMFTILAFVLEYMDNTLKTAEDVTRELELPVLGIIPEVDLTKVQQEP
ncbi:MAG: Wzz/FepE/Etk N-terminal domain-containing protein [Syntrophomonadaceae bacterium]|nr:Wzz/FepE/Etk N-terminal domain-containing protein [Syntrophomonadaceae bacterium]